MQAGARRRFALSMLCVVALQLAGCGSTADVPRIRPGLEYRVISQQPVVTGSRIEVIDFFWYGCPHCYRLQPLLEDWAQRRPPDVALRRIPAILRGSWAPHARIFYALEALGETERLHRQVYHDYHVKKLPMSQPEVVAAWAVEHGIDRAAWVAAYNAPETSRLVSEAQAAAKRYEVHGTPSLVVDGRFLTSSSMASSMSEVISNLEQLIELARRERAPR